MSPCPILDEERRRDIASFAASPLLPWYALGATILIALLLYESIARRSTRIRLEERLRFETLLSQLSAGLIHVPASGLDKALEQALGQVVTFLGADRGALDEHRSGEPSAFISWSAPGIEELPGIMETAEFPWTASRLRDDHIIMFSRTDELPDEAATDRRGYERIGTRSHVSLPLRARGAVLGALSLDAVRDERVWSDELVARLRLLSEAFASALERRRMDVSLAERDLEAQRLRQQLAHIGRVSAMGELTASLAHELNQPLTAILNNAQVAQRFLAADVVDVAEMREILSDIVADDKRAGDVIRRMRLLLKKGDLEYVSLDLNEVVTEVARLVMSDAAIRNIAILLETAPDLPRVLGDRGQLQQVVLNLVLNGLDAMRDSVARDRSVVIRTLPNGKESVAVAVRDAGPGIAQKDVDHIFDALYTTKTEGLGMGLAIARTIVEAHGGRLSVANNADEGATFQFTLPVEKAAR